MDFSNEPYVRYYRRKTTTWHRLSWEGQAVLSEVLVLIDRAGVFELAGLPPAEAVSLHLQKWPLAIVEAGVADMLRLKIIEHRGDSLVWPRYLEAQETPQSDRVRQAESRARRRERALEAPEPPAGPNGHGVTKCDEMVTKCDDTSQDVTETSRAVTSRHALSLLPSVPSVQCLQSREEKKLPSRALRSGGALSANQQARFDRFWGHVHRKVGKHQTEIEFGKINPDDELVARMIAAIEEQKRWPGYRPGESYPLPDPERWVKRRRWEDERPGGASVRAGEDSDDSGKWTREEQRIAERQRQLGVAH